MSSLRLGHSAQRVPTEFAELLQELGSRPQPAIVHYAADGARVELSGRVLANWATKLIGLFGDEHDLSPDDTVSVDVQLHWKAAAVMLAAGALGAEVQLAPARSEEPGAAAELVVTDRPLEMLGSESLGEAGLAAISHGLLDASFAEATGQQIPVWVTDISAEVRQYPDQLLTPLPRVPLPHTTGVCAEGPLVLTSWSSASYSQMLSRWGTHGVVVLFAGEPGGEAWELMCRNEGVEQT